MLSADITGIHFKFDSLQYQKISLPAEPNNTNTLSLDLLLI